MKVLVTNYKRYEKNTLQAFVDLEIVEIGLTIKGATVHQKEGSAWIGLPGREYKDEDGKKQWANILQFSKEKGEEFKLGAIEAIKTFVINEKQGASNDIAF
jgi:hypothetical protein